MKLVKAILLIIILGAVTPILWVLAPFYSEKEEKHGTRKNYQ